MSFAEVLRGMTETVGGATGAAVVGMDGIVVEEYSNAPDVDLQSVAAEYGVILKEVQIASDSLRLGHAREVSVTTETGDLIMRKINDDYFIALMLTRGGNYGKGRFMARVAAGKLQSEF